MQSVKIISIENCLTVVEQLLASIECSEEENIKNLLRQWKMPEFLIERCKELGITISHLDKIDKEDIGILIPDDQLGVRILFKDKLKNWILSHQEIPSSSTISSTSTSTTSTSTTSTPTTSAAINFRPSSFKIHELDVKQLLLSTSLGVELINYHKQHNNLHPKHQDVLANILISAVVEKGNTISVSQIEDLSANIVELFPSEQKVQNKFKIRTFIFLNTVHKDTYFIPRCGKINPRGKLFDKYRNLRKKLKNLGLLKTKSISSPSDFCQETQLITEGLFIPRLISTNATKLMAGETLREGANENKVWLKYHKDEWNLILEKWISTRNLRRSEVIQLSSTSEIFNQWPLFKDLRSPSLVDIDFNFLFPEKGDMLLIGWGQQKEKFKEIFQHSLTDIGSRSLFRKLTGFINENSEDCIVFLLLHGVIKPTSRITVKSVHHPFKKIQWKPSISDSQISCILHVITLNDVDRQINDLQSKYLELNLKLQPIIIVVGPDTSDIKSIYVRVDNVLLKFNTFLKCLDCTFKLYHVLHLQYPCESCSVWLFMQKFFFDIKTKSDQRSPIVSNFINMLSHV